MKKSFYATCAFLVLASISCVDSCLAQASYGYNDSTRKDYYDEWGQRQGYSKLQPYSNQTDHYDKWGHRQGYSRKDPYTGEVRHYDEWGRYQGSTR